MPVYAIVLLSLIGAAVLTGIGVGVNCATSGSCIAPGPIFEPTDTWADSGPYEEPCGDGWGQVPCDEDGTDGWDDGTDGWDDGTDGWNGVDSTDGSDTSVTCELTPESLDFGLIEVGDSATRELTVTCVGDVHGLTVQVLPSPAYPTPRADDADVTFGYIPPLVSGVPLTVSVTWTPDAPVIVDPFAALEVWIEVGPWGDATGYTVDLRGQTPAPELVLSEPSLDLGGARPGETVTGTVTVTNQGDAALTIADVTIDAATEPGDGSLWAATFESPGVLAPGESTTVTVAFSHPESGLPPGFRSQELEITSDDPHGESTIVPIRAALWTRERCALSVVGTASFPATTIPSQAAWPASLTVRNDGDGPCDAVMLALVSGAPAHDGLELPAACSVASSTVFDVVDETPTSTLGPGESVTLTTAFAAPGVGSRVSVPVGLEGRAVDLGMPVWNGETVISAPASPEGSCTSAITISAATVTLAGIGSTWLLPNVPAGCAPAQYAELAGSGAVCAVKLSAECEGALTLTSPLITEGDVECLSGGQSIGSGLTVGVERVGEAVPASCSLELTVSDDPPSTTSTAFAKGAAVPPETFQAPLGISVLFLRGPGAATGSDLVAQLPALSSALPTGTRVAFGAADGGIGLHATPGEGPVVSLAPETAATVSTLAESWLVSTESSETVPARLENALGATAWLLSAHPVTVGFGCTSDDHCTPPLVCRGNLEAGIGNCGGPNGALAPSTTTTVHVVWVGDAGPVDVDAYAALDRWQSGGVLRRHHLVVHRVARSAGDCDAPIETTGLVEDLRVETGGVVVDACGGADAWAALGSTITNEPAGYRLRYPAVPHTVDVPSTSLLCSTLNWLVSPSGRVVRAPPEPACKATPGSSFKVDYEVSCSP